MWSGMGAPSPRVGGPHTRPDLDAMTRSGSVGGLGVFLLVSWGCGEGRQVVIF